MLGGTCYTTYLYHGYPLGLVLALQRRYAMTGYFWLDTIAGVTAGLAFVLVMCVVAFVIFERPFMNPRWPAQLAERVRQARRKPWPAQGFLYASKEAAESAGSVTSVGRASA